MDAGLSLAEQLAKLANEHDPDRGLIVCVMASSLPIQTSSGKTVIRDEAVIDAADQLKALGATIFAFGDYHNAGRNLTADTEEHFSAVMTAICGSADTAEADRSSYYFSKSKSGSSAEALNEMTAQITVTVAQVAARDVTVQVKNVDKDSRTDKSQTWKDWLQDILNKTPDAEASISYYAYEADGFSPDPFEEVVVPLRDLLQADGTLQYETKLVPLRTQAASHNAWAADQGTKVVITISDPVSVSHQWVGDAASYAPADVDLPAAEYVAFGAYIIPQDLESTDAHYRFEGWYLDQDCTSLVAGAIAPLQSMTLYGKWTRFVLVSYYASAPYEVPDAVLWVLPDSQLTDYAIEQNGYTFLGWYTDADMTQPYDWTQPVTEDMSLYAKWAPAANTTLSRTASTADTVPELLRGSSDSEDAYVLGYPDGTVRPKASVTRAEIAAILYRLLANDVRDEADTTENAFADVQDGDWYCEAVSTLAALDIIQGRDDADFDPDAPITRAELAALCARLDEDGDAGDGSVSFSDLTGHWAEAEIKKAASLGWLQGYPDGTFRPNDTVTRAEVMTILNRILDRTPQTEADLGENANTWRDNLDEAQWYYLDVQEATNSHESN
jgi:uncharacterized repeat protein (TIGR02543 family)